MIKSTLLGAFCLLFMVSLTAQSPSFDAAALTDMLATYIGEDEPGLAVGIVQDGEVVYEHYWGYANLEHRIEFKESTRSNIASTAKQFTALMILELSMAGKLDLEDDIRQYIPALYPEVDAEIKIRHLINHTSGIRDYVFLLEMKNEAYWQQVGMDNDDVIELLTKQTELVFEPGTRYSYSNSGYTILAEIIERVTDQSFNDYSKAFFTGLGMQETAFIRRYMGIIPNRADSYSDWGSGVWLAEPLVTKFNGDGFLFTTLKDQLIFERAVQRAAAEHNELLLRGQQAIPNSEIKTYGFGLELDGRIGRKAQYHSGSTFGYHSHTSRFPEEQLTIFVMSNNGTIWSGDIADKMARFILPERAATAIKLPQGTGPVVGQYTSPRGALVRIVAEEGKMYWRRGNRNPLELLSEGENRYSFAYNPQEKLVFYADKMILYSPSGEEVIYGRSNELPASYTDLEGFMGEYHSSELEMSFVISRAENQTLMIKFSNRNRPRKLTVLNRNELAASNFALRVKRDQFERPRDILVTLNYRAQDNRFTKKTKLQFQPKIATDNGTIQVTTIGAHSGEASDILLTKNYPNGNEIWFKQFGGKSYDKASSLIATEDGYLIIGSTSSYGSGNYDMFVIKTDKEGKQQWQNTYGGFYNEYGYLAEETTEGYLLKGTVQHCSSNSDVLNRECTTNVWFVSIDKEGNELSNQVLEEY